MPWEIPIYICSRFAEALEQIYIPVWLPPPTLFGLEKGCTLDMYCVHIWIIRYHVYIWILYILYTRMDTLLKLPLGVSDGKPKKFRVKIFLTKVLFLETKTSEYYLESNSASRKLIKLSNHGTDCFSQPAHWSRIDVGRSQLWHEQGSLHLSGATQAAERR